MLGTLVRGPRSLTIVLDVPLALVEVRAFYDRVLVAEGWEALNVGPGAPRGGFVHSTFVNFKLYTHPTGWTLNLQTTPADDDLTDTHISVNKEEHPGVRARRFSRDIISIFPSLLPPEGATQQSQGGGGGSNSVYTGAILELPKAQPISDLGTHYAQQLKQAGWTLLESEQTKRTAWSTWRFYEQDGEEWLGAFYLFPLAGDSPRYQLSLRADVPDAPVLAGGFGFSRMG